MNFLNRHWFLILGVFSFLASKSCQADWTTTIKCPPEREYKDIRQDAGRWEYCEKALPGSLRVLDGPSRSWLNPSLLGTEGSYQDGRQIGHWKECDRFGNCRELDYDLLYSNEREHNVTPQIPISYSDGKYTFDFASCWGTEVSRQMESSSEKVLIGRGPIRCEVTYEGPRGNYFCQIPHSVGTRTFNSFHVREELLTAGVPQFCRKDDPPLSVMTKEPYLHPGAQMFTLSVGPSLGWATLANAVDIECIAISSSKSEGEILYVRFNPFVEGLILEYMGKYPMKAATCVGRDPLEILDIKESNGRMLFPYRVSNKASVAKRQMKCLATQLSFAPNCLINEIERNGEHSNARDSKTLRVLNP
jgi:hypothetical protein